MKIYSKLAATAALLALLSACHTHYSGYQDTPTAQRSISMWLTTADGRSLLQRQPDLVPFTTDEQRHPTITIDTTTTYQTVEGFGFTLTGGSAMLIHRMADAPRKQLLEELFRCDNEAMCVSYLRVSMGASDLDAQVFSYNDTPDGAPDPELAYFSLANDTVHLLPVLREVLSIHPNLSIMASPWSPPSWMKSNNSSVGGQLLPQFYGAYAQYFVKYIQAMGAQGIRIGAVTLQNEPQHGGNNPSMLMSAAEQAEFVRDYLGPAFSKAGITTEIVVWDHNCDNPKYPIAVLDDAGARRFVAGSAFHLYAGDISAMSDVHRAHPDKKLYFTEQWTGSEGTFQGDYLWHTKNVVIGSLRHWAVTALEWNLANDPYYGPHTPGGCTQCKGALTISGDTVVRNVSYYVVAQAAAFVPPGTVRVASSGAEPLHHVALLRSDGKKVLLVLNDSSQTKTFQLQHAGQKATLNLPAESGGVFVW